MLNRKKYGDYVRDRLVELCVAVRIDSSDNLHDESVLSELLFAKLFNGAFDWELENANLKEFNRPGYDLIDESRHILVQISSTARRKKIQETLEKSVFEEYGGYRLVFMLIVEKKPLYRKPHFNNLYNLNFDQDNDIWDVSDLVSRIRALEDFNALERVYEVVKEELGKSVPHNPEHKSYIAEVARILIESTCDASFSEDDEGIFFGFEEKITQNSLQDVRDEIVELTPYTVDLDKAYDEYDRVGSSGKNRLLTDIHRTYRKMKRECSDPDKLYDDLIDAFADRVEQDSACPPDASSEDIRWSAGVVVVDAFLRCRVFEGPDLKSWAKKVDEHAIV